MKPLFILSLGILLHYSPNVFAQSGDCISVAAVETVDCNGTPIAFDFSQEDRINQNGFSRDLNQYAEESATFFDAFKTGSPYNQSPLSDECGIVSLQAVKQLFDIANGMPHDPNAYYITGMKIWFGLENDQIVFLYQPMKMTFNGGKKYLTPNMDNGIFYKYNDGTGLFDVASPGDMAVLADYADHVVSKKYLGALSYGQFWDVNNYEAIGDSRYTVFPFQELVYLYKNNGDAALDGNIYMLNVAGKFTSNDEPSFENRFKHHLYIGVQPDESSSLHAVKSASQNLLKFRTIYAPSHFSNLGGLCPPDRSFVRYNYCVRPQWGY